jgi:hypothetical protein
MHLPEYRQRIVRALRAPQPQRGLSPWYQEAPLVEDQPSVEKVTLQLRQHIGAGADQCWREPARLMHLPEYRQRIVRALRAPQPQRWAPSYR